MSKTVRERILMGIPAAHPPAEIGERGAWPSSIVSLALALAGSLLAAFACHADVLYVSDAVGSRIVRLPAGYATATLYAGSGRLDGAEGIAFDPAGNLYVANWGSDYITEVRRSDGVEAIFAINSALQGAIGLAFDGAGNLYVANSQASTIERFTPAGAASVFASSGLNQPFSLAFDRSGNLYASNWGNNTIVRFTPGGAESVFASTGLANPAGLAFDAAGNLYVANEDRAGAYAWIEKITPLGSPTVFANHLYETRGLAFDSVGDLYATDGYGNITEFAADGTAFSFASTVPGPTGLAFTTDDGTPLPLPPGVPEPAALSLLCAAAGCLLLPRRRRRTVSI